MKKNLKKLAILALIGLFVVSFTACGDAKKEQEYKEQAESIATSLGTSMTDLSTAMSSTKDYTNKEWQNKVLDEIAKVKADSEKLRDLEAPEKYAEGQTKLKQGAESFIKAMDLYSEGFKALQKGKTSTFSTKVLKGNDYLLEGSTAISDGASLLDKAEK